jgi:SAM-dependent methyltransferase
MSVKPISSTRGAGTIGTHGDRISGLRDLLCYAKGMSILDVGTNHGLLAFEFARRGAPLVHGCDIHAPGVAAAREIFTETETVSRFEVVDLAKGPRSLEDAFGSDYRVQYDIVLFLGMYHKLKEQASDATLPGLIRHLIDRAGRYFAVRTMMIDELQVLIAGRGLRKVHFSALSPVVGPVEIWQRS